MKRLLFLLIAIPLLVACNDDVQEKTYVGVATVDNPDNSTTFYLNQDDSLRLKVVENYYNSYRPKTGQRLIVRYALLDKMDESQQYDYSVKLASVYEILTKGVFEITEETQDSIGNDPVNIRDMWIANDHLNVEFSYYGHNQKHFINLVHDAGKTYTDGKLHLEFRHNNKNDYPSYYTSGIVSFNLADIQILGQGQMDIVVHVNEFGSNGADKTFGFKYKYADRASDMLHKILPDLQRTSNIE